MRRLNLLLVLVAACFSPDNSSSGDTESTGSTGTEADSTDPTPGTTLDTGSMTSTTMGTTATGPTTTAGTTGGATCAEDELCIPAAPQGWAGPAILRFGTDSAVPECDGVYPVGGANGFATLEGAPAECECDCDAITDVTCEDASATFHFGQGCDDAQGGGAISTTCSTLFLQSPLESFSAEPPAITGGRCAASLSETIPPETIADGQGLCLPRAFGDACGEEAFCVPQSATTTYCISSEGDVPCPGGTTFGTRTVLFTGSVDTRECGGCGCDPPEGTCNVRIEPFTEDQCLDPGTEVFFADGTCQNSSNNYESAIMSIVDTTGGCPAVGGDPMGELTPQNPVTICCAEF